MSVNYAQEHRQNLQELKTQITLLNLHLYLITYSNAWHANGGQLAMSASEEVGKERAVFFCYWCRQYCSVPRSVEVSSSSGGLGKAALFELCHEFFFGICKNKTQISCVVSAQLNSTFVFTILETSSL